ncbi:MAG TPA: ParA family protein [Burkholderiales bacterium]|jgi:chromosome partitioning protein|nr:ParA family protein [Burkholderiales bacterium]
MRAVLVANPKGGAGKTTLATNLAGALAARGEKVFLWDLDRQQSSMGWLAMRPADRPAIQRLDGKDGDDPKLPRGASWLVLDSAAGLHGKNLTHALKLAHKVVVPVQPSLFDMAATNAFLQALVEEKAVRKQKAFIGIVGMRVDPRTRAAATLEAFLAQFRLPVLTYLRDTQTYVNAAFNGLSIFDLPQYLASRDAAQWAPLLDWVGRDD